MPMMGYFLSENLLDIVVGMHVYTYPRIDEVSLIASVPRPHGFSVYEIVNNVDLRLIQFNEMGRVERCGEAYVYIVEKINLDSFVVCNVLKKLMKCRRCEFLGLKDTEAIARQVLVLKGCAEPRAEINKNIGEGTIRAFLWQCDTNIVHQGNGFSIRVKTVAEHLDAIKKRMRFLEEHGYRFLNFFGYQRFGTRKPITHLLGKLLVKRDWDKLVEVVCRSKTRYSPRTPEYSMCKAWNRYRDESAAIKSIPRDYAILYINAYQSYLFNLILSKVWLKLIEECGFEKAFKELWHRYRYLPIIGSELHVHQGHLKRVVEEVLEAEELKPEYFNIEILNVNVKGDLRKSVEQAYSVVTDFSPSEVKIMFTLDRGCYATVFLREILRVDPASYA